MGYWHGTWGVVICVGACTVIAASLLSAGGCSNDAEEPSPPAKTFDPDTDTGPKERLATPMRFGRTTGPLPESQRSREAIARVRPGLEADLSEHGLPWGAPVYIQIFKTEKLLRMHLFDATKGYFVPWRQYTVVNVSGLLGPKLAEGDKQGPEGFYYIKADRLNPNSMYHLAVNIGYPNAYDALHNRTGDSIMIHGSNGSIGCFAMGDEAAEEIYAMADAALRTSQRILRVHIFPFEMTDKNFTAHADSRWEPFWRNLQEGYNFFDAHRLAPNVDVRNGRYVFNADW